MQSSVEPKEYDNVNDEGLSSKPTLRSFSIISCLPTIPSLRDWFEPRAVQRRCRTPSRNIIVTTISQSTNRKTGRFTDQRKNHDKRTGSISTVVLFRHWLLSKLTLLKVGFKDNVPTHSQQSVQSFPFRGRVFGKRILLPRKVRTLVLMMLYEFVSTSDSCLTL